MIYKLDEEAYKNIKTLLIREDEISNLAINAVIDGTSRGIVYVDNTDNPETALIYAVGTILMLVGDPHNKDFNNDFNRLIDNELRQDFLDTCGGTWFKGTSFDERWEAVLIDLFSHRNYETYNECIYKFDVEKFILNKTSAPSINKATIRKIDKQLLNNAENEEIFEDFWDFWKEEEDFLKRGFGYCVVEENKVLSACFSAYVSENNHEIYVRTLEEARNRGLATLSCMAYINDCLEKGYEPHWSTYEANIRSCQLAERCGFKLNKKLIAFEFEV